MQFIEEQVYSSALNKRAAYQNKKATPHHWAGFFLQGLMLVYIVNY